MRVLFVSVTALLFLALGALEYVAARGVPDADVPGGASVVVSRGR